MEGVIEGSCDDGIDHSKFFYFIGEGVVRIEEIGSHIPLGRILHVAHAGFIVGKHRTRREV